MSNSLTLCENFIFFSRASFRRNFSPYGAFNSIIFSGGQRRQLHGLITCAKKDGSDKKKPWWQLFFDDEGNWFGLKEDDLLEDPECLNDTEMPELERFEAWKSRAEAICELREAQEDAKNAESRQWEDWIMEDLSSVDNASSDGDWADGLEELNSDGPRDPREIMPEKGIPGAIRDLVVGSYEDELLYEDRVFRFASWNSAKFLALLVIVPMALDFLVHDYIFLPFLDRYVKKVPLAAEMLDVRRSQKLKMVKTLEIEKARFRFEVEIGKSPLLSDEETWLELQHKAIELRDEWRLENRRAFANIFSDMVFGVSLFFLIYFNQSKVALLKFTGYKLLNNISDSGKAFLIILVTDIFLGYHSESGWQTLIEIILEHYGLEVDEAAVTIFVCFVPVVIDACVKLWLFKFLPQLSPRVANIFREMKRH